MDIIHIYKKFEFSEILKFKIDFLDSSKFIFCENNWIEEYMSISNDFKFGYIFWLTNSISWSILMLNDSIEFKLI